LKCTLTVGRLRTHARGSWSIVQPLKLMRNPLAQHLLTADCTEWRALSDISRIVKTHNLVLDTHLTKFKVQAFVNLRLIWLIAYAPLYKCIIIKESYLWFDIIQRATRFWSMWYTIWPWTRWVKHHLSHTHKVSDACNFSMSRSILYQLLSIELAQNLVHRASLFLLISKTCSHWTSLISRAEHTCMLRINATIIRYLPHKHAWQRSLVNIDIQYNCRLFIHCMLFMKPLQSCLIYINLIFCHAEIMYIHWYH
jgi:hypothetical protein